MIIIFRAKIALLHEIFLVKELERADQFFDLSIKSELLRQPGAIMWRLVSTRMDG